MRLQTHKLFQIAVLAATTLGSWASTSFAASEYVVVAVDPAADGPTLGTLYKLGDLLHIESGSTVTLLGDDGSVTALPGPADIVVTEDEAGSATGKSPASPSKLSAISDLLSNGGRQLQSIGASRGTGETTPAGLEPWTVPVEDGTTGCIREGRLELWREPGEKATVSIGYDELPVVAGLAWEAGSPKMVAPGPVPAEVKSAAVTIDKHYSQMALKQLPPNVSPRDYVMLYGWMVGSGCALQASALIRELASSNDNP